MVGEGGSLSPTNRAAVTEGADGGAAAGPNGAGAGAGAGGVTTAGGAGADGGGGVGSDGVEIIFLSVVGIVGGGRGSGAAGADEGGMERMEAKRNHGRAVGWFDIMVMEVRNLIKLKMK